MSRVYKKDTFYLCSCIFILSVIIKIFQFSLLPDKYFYDSYHIMNLMNGNYVADKAYNYTAKFFDTINIFHFSTLLEWAILLSIIFTTIIFFFLIKKEKYTLTQYIFIYANIALLNIYVFNLSKDIIQFIYFLLIYIIVMNKKLSNTQKLIGISCVLLYEALNFRIYYGLMALLMWTLYFIYKRIKENNQKNNVIKLIIYGFLLFFLEVFIVQLVSYENYQAIIEARSNVNISRMGSTDANTMINDLLGHNNNYFIFIGNYIINTVRLMFPLELIKKGVKYLPFIIYQLFITWNLFKVSRKINQKNILILLSIISFLMISIIFEPDFGSFIRHESAMVLFLLEINCILNDNKEIKKTSKFKKSNYQNIK